MLKRLNSSVPVLCVSSMLLIGGCGDAQTASTSATPAASRDTSTTESAPLAPQAQPGTTAALAENPETKMEPLVPQAMPAAATPGRETVANRSFVVAEPAVLSLGDMATNETKAGIVTLRNTGDQPIKVLDSRTSCGCTVANVPKGQELGPGESVEVEVSLRGSARPEHLSKTVTFMIENQAPITVRVEGKTVSYVVIEPAIIQLDELPENRVVIRAEDGEPFRITAMHPRIAEDLSQERKTTHEVILSNERWEELGQPRRLLFYLDHPKVNQVSSAIRVPASHVAHVTREDGTIESRVSTPVRVTPDALIAQNRTDEFLSQFAEGTISVSATDRAGTTLLGLAAKQGNTTIMQALLDAGAEFEATDRGGRTPLMHAAQSKNPDAVRMLLHAGANVDVRDTTLANTALSWAAGFGDAESVRELLDAGAQTEIVSDHTGFTPLILASGFGEADSIRHLVAAGASIEAVDTLQGFTAIMYAASTGKVENIRTLIQSNANIEAKDPNGRTVLLVAAGTAGADAETIKALIEAGADVTATDRSGRNALEHAQARTDPRRDEVLAVLEPLIAASGE